MQRQQDWLLFLSKKGEMQKGIPDLPIMQVQVKILLKKAGIAQTCFHRQKIQMPEHGMLRLSQQNDHLKTLRALRVVTRSTSSIEVA